MNKIIRPFVLASALLVAIGVAPPPPPPPPYFWNKHGARAD